MSSFWSSLSLSITVLHPSTSIYFTKQSKITLLKKRQTVKKKNKKQKQKTRLAREN